MISLSLKLNNNNQLDEFCTVVNFIFVKNKTLLQAEEYYHYYNLRALLKKTLDKKYSTFSTRKVSSLRININEFESLKFMYLLQPQILEAPERLYYKIFVMKVIADLDKMVANVNITLLD